MTITRITTTAPPLIPWIPAMGDQIRAQFGASLQEPECDRWWIFASDWQCRIATDCGAFVVTIKRGAGIDLASIPSAFEWLEKRDDRRGLIAAICHDAFFAIHCPEFDLANNLFYQIMRYDGMSWFRAWRRWKAVCSPAGRMAWDDGDDEQKIEYEKRWFNVRWSDK